MTVISLSPNASNREYGEGETFDLDINVDAVTDLYAYEIRLDFDPLILSASALYPSSGSTNESGFFFTDYYMGGHIVNNVSGFVRIAVLRPLTEETGVTGSGKLVTVTFEVLEWNKTTNLTFNITTLLDSDVGKISHTSTDGTFTAMYTAQHKRYLDLKDYLDQTRDGSKGIPANLRGEVQSYGTDETWVSRASGEKGKKKEKSIREKLFG